MWTAAARKATRSTRRSTVRRSRRAREREADLGASCALLQAIQKDPVTNAGRIGAPGRLKGEAASVRRHGRIRRLVPVPVAPARHAHELGAVRREGELPQIDVPRILAVRTLIAARLD